MKKGVVFRNISVFTAVLVGGGVCYEMILSNYASPQQSKPGYLKRFGKCIHWHFTKYFNSNDAKK